jgi:redox-sensitive bicupin YhaK (pirin superfamily)
MPIDWRGQSVSIVTNSPASMYSCRIASGPFTQPLTDPLYLDVSLEAGTRFSEALETDHNAFVYVISGELRLEDTDGVQLKLVRDQLAVLSRGDKVESRLVTKLDACYWWRANL